MVASSKLHRAQAAIESMRPYQTVLDKMMSAFVANMADELESPYAEEREVHKAVLVVYTSNSSLCGGFNGNVVKALRRKLAEYSDRGVSVERIYVIGKKGSEAAKKLNVATLLDHSALLDAPTYDGTANVARELMALYADGQVDEVVMLYHHFKSSASQILKEETFLPISLNDVSDSDKGTALNYIVEPSQEEIVEALIPKSLCLRLYAALLDSLASEHAARVIAMQVATDNADDLLHELTLTYNKTRQQAITTELLDIVGGSMQ